VVGIESTRSGSPGEKVRKQQTLDAGAMGEERNARGIVGQS